MAMRQNIPSNQSGLGSYDRNDTIGKYVVQCIRCRKWRVVSSKEKYENIRQHFSQRPFVCTHAREWRANASCEDPADEIEESATQWAIDKPDIVKTPIGWNRLIRVRKEGGSKFCDVYYVAPNGKFFRSMREVRLFFLMDPKCATQHGATLAQFSFKAPMPLRKDYVKKREPSTVPEGAGTSKLAKPNISEDPSGTKTNQIIYVEPLSVYNPLENEEPLQDANEELKEDANEEVEDANQELQGDPKI